MLGTGIRRYRSNGRQRDDSLASKFSPWLLPTPSAKTKCPSCIRAADLRKRAAADSPLNLAGASLTRRRNRNTRLGGASPAFGTKYATLLRCFGRKIALVRGNRRSLHPLRTRVARTLQSTQLSVCWSFQSKWPIGFYQQRESCRFRVETTGPRSKTDIDCVRDFSYASSRPQRGKSGRRCLSSLRLPRSSPADSQFPLIWFEAFRTLPCVFDSVLLHIARRFCASICA